MPVSKMKSGLHIKGNPINHIKKIAKIIRKGPPAKREILILSKECDKKAKKICEPSRGGIGIKLKTPKMILIQVKQARK